MMNEKVEAAEAVEPEVVDQAAMTVPDREENMSGDQMDAVIAVAEKMDQYSKAMDTILNHVIKRSYPGDWVVHAKQDDPEEKKKANIGAAAAERIATFLGIRETNWTAGAKEWSDDHKHYTYIYEADFTFGKRTVHAIGKAGTRDKFFGFANGQWKPLDEVQEDHIRTAAFRAARKEGVRALLGLRGIPLSKLKELGYDLGMIAYAGFESKGKTLSADAKKDQDKATGFIKRVVKIKEIKKGWEGDKGGKPSIRYDVTDIENIVYSFFGGTASKRAAILIDVKNSGEPVEILFVTQMYNGREQYQIVKVNGTVDA